MDCVFCGILNGEEPASFVYEDEVCVTFLVSSLLCLVVSSMLWRLGFGRGCRKPLFNRSA